ncbi:hypothetical protein DFH11DRAFT_1590720 [Phellopilus nigrolimitatus]|nr:hypothetical protein DFH11DRAFT_1590720 [Phellopilus nigrolimitatus]
MPVERQHHPSLWISDGNIVLSANKNSGTEHESSKSEVLFRVHKGVLARHSQVFAGMFTLPEVSEFAPGVRKNANEMYEGVPFIVMPDSADEIEAMLHVLYDPLYLKLERRDSDLPVSVTPLMTVVRKYQLDAIGAHIAKHVKDDWPTTLDEWDEVDAQTQPYPANTFLQAWPLTLLPEPVAALRFSRLFDMKAILSAVFYDLSRCWYSENWPEKEPKSPFNPNRKGARWNLLSAQDFLRLGQLKEAVAKCIVSLAEENPSRLLSGNCTYSTDEERIKIAQEEISTEALASRDALRVLRRYTNEDTLKTRGLCRSCAQTFATKIRTLRVVVWGAVSSTVYKNSS